MLTDGPRADVYLLGVHASACMYVPVEIFNYRLLITSYQGFFCSPKLNMQCNYKLIIIFRDIVILTSKWLLPFVDYHLVSADVCLLSTRELLSPVFQSRHYNHLGEEIVIKVGMSSFWCCQLSLATAKSIWQYKNATGMQLYKNKWLLWLWYYELFHTPCRVMRTASTKDGWRNIQAGRLQCPRVRDYSKSSSVYLSRSTVQILQWSFLAADANWNLPAFFKMNYCHDFFVAGVHLVTWMTDMNSFIWNR